MSDQKLLGKVAVITGGASQLKNLPEFLKDKLKMPVRKASARKTAINNFPDLANDPSLTQALGLLLFGWDNCEKVEVEKPVEEAKPAAPTRGKDKPEKPQKKGTGFFTKMESMLGGMFTEDEGND